MVAQNSIGEPLASDDVQRAALMRDLGPFRRQAGLLEKVLGLLQILLGEDAHADALGLAARRALA